MRSSTRSVQRDDPVSDSGLRRRSRLLVAVFAYPERGHGKGREQCGDVVEELRKACASSA